jgi:hypothetical protein
VNSKREEIELGKLLKKGKVIVAFSAVAGVPTVIRVKSFTTEFDSFYCC